MRIELETWGNCDFESIQEEYGCVLKQFDMEKTISGRASIEIHSHMDLFILNQRLKDYCDEIDRPLPYFGLMIQSREDGTTYLEIKDNYD